MLDKALEFEKVAFETAVETEIERADRREVVEQKEQELRDTLQVAAVAKMY
jgi:hypothetical protein